MDYPVSVVGVDMSKNEDGILGWIRPWSRHGLGWIVRRTLRIKMSIIICIKMREIVHALLILSGEGGCSPLFLGIQPSILAMMESWLFKLSYFYP